MIFDFFKSRKSSSENDNDASENASFVTPNSTQKSNSDYPIFLSGKAILERPKCKDMLVKIRREIKVDDEYYAKYYYPILETTASYCQDVSASMEKHHTYPFGLIEHILEVILYGLRSSKKYVFNPTGRESEIEELEPLYHYCIFISAALHDLAKVFTDNRFELRALGSKHFVAWHPAESLPPEGDVALEYRFRRKIDSTKKTLYHYSTHSFMASSLLGRVVPRDGLRWILTAHPKVETMLYHSIAGDYEHAAEIGAALLDGDRYSVEEIGLSTVASISESSASVPGKLKSIIGKLLETPSDFGVEPSVTGEGFVSCIRFDDKVFFACDGLVKAITPAMQKADITIPSKDSKKTGGMIAEHVGAPAPSGDSMWWAQVQGANQEPVDETSNKKKRGKKDVMWVVFNVTDYKTVNIPEANEGVGLKISDKSVSKEEAADKAAKVEETREQEKSDQTQADINRLLGGIQVPNDQPQKDEANPASKEEDKESPSDKGSDSAERTSSPVLSGDALGAGQKKPKKRTKSENTNTALAAMQAKSSVEPSPSATQNTTEQTSSTVGDEPKSNDAPKPKKKATRNGSKRSRKSSVSLPSKAELGEKLGEMPAKPANETSIENPPASPLPQEPVAAPIPDPLPEEGVTVASPPPSLVDEPQLMDNGYDDRVYEEPGLESVVDVGVSKEPEQSPSGKTETATRGVSPRVIMSELPDSLMIAEGSAQKNALIIDELIPKIQQGLDSRTIRFNRSGSLIFNTNVGLILSSPNFFGGKAPIGDESRANDLKHALVGSSLIGVHRITGTNIHDFLIKLGQKQIPISGYLLPNQQQFGLTYNGKPLPLLEVSVS